VEIAGYKACATCQEQVLDFVAWQTGGICFECFVKGDLSRLRQIEVVQRATRHTVTLPGANQPATHKKKAKRRSNSKNVVRADLARIRALRRLATFFPDVFAVLYAEERWRDGLQPKPLRQKDVLKNAVLTYEQFAAYYQTSNRSGDGTS